MSWLIPGDFIDWATAVVGEGDTYYAANSTKPVGNSTKRNQNTAICASFFIVVVVITR